MSLRYPQKSREAQVGVLRMVRSYCRLCGYQWCHTEDQVVERKRNSLRFGHQLILYCRRDRILEDLLWLP
jgi:hypothetical protein